MINIRGHAANQMLITKWSLNVSGLLYMNTDIQVKLKREIHNIFIHFSSLSWCQP